MTLPQLEYIVAVDNFKHFSKAAEHCFITQPTLSIQIQKLEDELGILIFDRSKQPVSATEMGVKVLRQARIILQEANRLTDIVENETGENSGILRVGIIPTVAPYLIPLFLKSLTEKHPKIELIINEITTREIVRYLKKDLIDVGILALPINNVDLIEQSLYYEPFLLYVSPQHPLYYKEKIKVGEIPREDLLLLKEGHCFREQTLRLCGDDKGTGKNEKKFLFESGSINTLMKLVEQNFGITLLPCLAMNDIADEERKQYVRKFENPVPKREIGLIYSKALIKRNLISVLAKEVKESVPKELLDKEESLIVPL
jgi:LysR family hydrogen peroxide-inducible transcriptional activator